MNLKNTGGSEKNCKNDSRAGDECITRHFKNSSERRLRCDLITVSKELHGEALPGGRDVTLRDMVSGDG